MEIVLHSSVSMKVLKEIVPFQQTRVRIPNVVVRFKKGLNRTFGVR